MCDDIDNPLDNSFKWYEDEVFLTELNRRSMDYRTGKVKGVSWEVAMAQILSSRNSKNIDEQAAGNPNQ